VVESLVVCKNLLGLGCENELTADIEQCTEYRSPPDHWEDPRLVVIISVCAHTKVDFLRESINFVSGRQFEDTVDSIPDQT